MQTRTESVGAAARKQWFGALLITFFVLSSYQNSSAGIVAGSQIVFQGWGVVNSYDSSDPAKSSQGKYSSMLAQSNGFVDCSGRVDLGAVRVYGQVVAYGQFSFPDVALPVGPGVAPISGSVVSVVGTNQNVTALVTNSLTPPPLPDTNQTLIATTNSTSITTTNYPGNQPGLKTNYTAVIVFTNRVVTIVSTNYMCGTNYYTSNSLPTNVCSYYIVGPGPGPHSYKYTVIEGTNYLFNTNLVYVWGTNITYTYTQFNYTYILYSTVLVYQTNYYDHIVCGDSFMCYSLAGQTLVTCPSRIVLTNGFLMSGSDTITIAAGGSLALYVGGGDCTVPIMNILNGTGYATNFVVYCARDVTNLALNGSGALAGVIVAPRTQVAINPGGSTPLEFSGFLMARSVVVNGNLNFHYDESLAAYTHSPDAVHPTQTAGGAFVFHVNGASGLSYLVQASTNLVDWFPLATNIGAFDFIDNNTDVSDRKFYRVLWP